MQTKIESKRPTLYAVPVAQSNKYYIFDTLIDTLAFLFVYDSATHRLAMANNLRDITVSVGAMQEIVEFVKNLPPISGPKPEEKPGKLTTTFELMKGDMLMIANYCFYVPEDMPLVIAGTDVAKNYDAYLQSIYSMFMVSDYVLRCAAIKPVITRDFKLQHENQERGWYDVAVIRNGKEMPIALLQMPKLKAHGFLFLHFEDGLHRG